MGSRIGAVDCQRAFDDWRQRYNHERPHETLGMATPAQRYRPSSRPFPEVLPPVEYSVDDQVRKVGSDGFPTGEDGVLVVYFCAHRAGAIGLREADGKACGPVDNAAHCPQRQQEEQQQHTVFP